MSRASSFLRAVRTTVAYVLWLGCALAAVVLAAGALLVALQISRDFVAADLLLRAGDAVDLGVFAREDGVAQFWGRGADVKNALSNWGLAAVVWLLAGQILIRVIRPRPTG